ncbi:hypothetical protein K8I31_05425 [bacterium]|nr:hypothetical protein [bacterium]
MTNSIELFHPLIQAWFMERLGGPTEVQQRAWPSGSAFQSGLHRKLPRTCHACKHTDIKS